MPDQSWHERTSLIWRKLATQALVATEGRTILSISFPFLYTLIMARFTGSLGVAYHAVPSYLGLRTELRLVNLHSDEELDEEYLTQVDPKS